MPAGVDLQDANAWRKDTLHHQGYRVLPAIQNSLVHRIALFDCSARDFATLGAVAVTLGMYVLSAAYGLETCLCRSLSV